MNNKINPRSFTLTKFLLTLGLVLLYSISLIAIFNIKLAKNEKLLLTNFNYFLIQTFILIISLICFLAFLLIRINICKKLNYHYNKKEKNYLIIIFIVFALQIIITLINFFNICFLFKNIYILLIVMLSIQLLFGITISILENFLRINEQTIVNKRWFDDQNKSSGNSKIIINELENKNDLNQNSNNIKKDSNQEVNNPFLQEEEND